MTLLAIGATGFIGPHVVRQLTQQNHDVTVFHRGETAADLPDAVRSIHGNRNALAEHRAAFERLAPDAAIDLVAISSSDVYRNYDGWRGVSDHAPDPVPLGENAPLRDTLYPCRGYEELDFAYADDYDKILVERTVMGADSLASTVLRLPAVYGPGNARHRLAPHLRRMDDGRSALLMGEWQADWRWTHGYVENVAAAITHAVTDERATGQVVNVGEATTPTAAGRVEALGRVVGWAGAVVPLPAEQLPEHLHASCDWHYELATDTRRLCDELGFQPPVTLEEALRRTVEWERAHRPADAEPPADEYAAEDAARRQAC